MLLSLLHELCFLTLTPQSSPIQTDLATKLISKPLMDSRLTQTKIISLWTSIMGPTISRYTRDIKVTRKGKLLLTIESASLRQELSMGKDKIKKVLNEELGEEYIKEVVIL